MDLRTLALPCRVTNALRRQFGVETIEELELIPAHRLKQARRIGKKSLAQIHDALKGVGKSCVETCQVEGCLNLPKYALFRLHPDGKKEWLEVCYRHEQEIGDENMRRRRLRNEREG